ncbi:MAG: hypothetical protein AB7S78_02780 [Candidatus Omnitrophota bacterium]
MFRKSDYIPFGLGIFILGGLFFVPLIWSRLNQVDFEDAILPSIISCLVFFIAHDNRGNFSIGRFIMGLVLVYFLLLRTIAKYGGGGQSLFIAGGFLGYIVMFGCGWAGIMLGRLIRGKEKLEQELQDEQKAIAERVTLEKQQTNPEAMDISDQALIAKQNTPFQKFMAITYIQWKRGTMDPLSDLFKKEAEQNSFEKFIAGHEKYKKDFETSHLMRNIQEAEYLVSLTEKTFFMTSKAIYILMQPAKVILIEDIAEYRLEGVLSITMNATLKNGEHIVYPKMKAAPAEKFVVAFRDGRIT